MLRAQLEVLLVEQCSSATVTSVLNLVLDWKDEQSSIFSTGVPDQGDEGSSSVRHDGNQIVVL